MKKKTGILRIIAIVLLILVGVLATPVFNLYNIEFDLNNQRHVVWEYGTPYEDAPVSCKKVAILLPLYKQDIEFEKSGNVDVNKLGVYQITYTATLKDKKEEVRRTISVEDNTLPVITLTSDPDYYTLPGHKYVEEGYQVMDNYDGDITDRMEFKSDGEFMYYTVCDTHGNIAEATREIVYDDRKGPEFHFPDGKEVSVALGVEFTDRFEAIDDLDGDVTDKVKVEGDVNTNAIGSYTRTYTVSDSYGNVTKEERKINVIETQGTVYLTFDDGPSAYTSQLLDILDRYGVKVTFFVTSAYPSYAYNIKRAYEAGHTIAIHSLTHNYAKIYSSDQAYWDDFNAMQDIVYQQTGTRPIMFRFPGGSSNTVSWNYSEGIMTRLAQQSREKGYVYFDWNVSSGEAGETTSTAVVYQNVIDGISRFNTSVVLCHDTHDYTVNAVEDIILWCRNHGYSIKPLTPNSFTAHHGINN